jgi:hypothetical protein
MTRIFLGRAGVRGKNLTEEAAIHRAAFITAENGKESMRFD